MAYTEWSVVAFEQPTASKWNILGDNDASFNDGTGIGEAAIIAKHIDAIGFPQGHLINGKISVSVASNNITVAIKTLAGADPSSTDPVFVRIKDTVRKITAALSVTKNAGTNWFGSGATGLATKEIDYFVYLIWNTTPATDIMDVGFARIPNGKVYSEFSGTSTNEKYLAFGNGSTPTSTDDCVNVGRFAATLSATASFNWSVPTFTSANLIQHPIFETRLLDYTSTIVGFSGTPTQVFKYKISRDRCQVIMTVSGTSNATNLTFTVPFTNALAVNIAFPAYGSNSGGDNQAQYTLGASAALVSSNLVLGSSAGTPVTLGAWTNSGSKAAGGVMLDYFI